MKLPINLHGPMCCKIGDTCVYNGHVLYTRQSNRPVSKFNRPYNEFMSVWSMFPCNTYYQFFSLVLWVRSLWSVYQAVQRCSYLVYHQAVWTYTRMYQPLSHLMFSLVTLSGWYSPFLHLSNKQKVDLGCNKFNATVKLCNTSVHITLVTKPSISWQHI